MLLTILEAFMTPPPNSPLLTLWTPATGRFRMCLALKACSLARLATHGDDAARAQAGAVERLLQHLARAPCRGRGQSVPGAIGQRVLTAGHRLVRTLQRDHGWIEKLVELVRACGPWPLARGGWIDETEFLNYVEVFVALMEGHIALEETLIYPNPKPAAQAVAGRLKRLDAAQGA